MKKLTKEQQKNIKMGVKVEKEHTKSSKKALKISKDHVLKEKHPNYYSVLKKAEKKMKKSK